MSFKKKPKFQNTLFCLFIFYFRYKEFIILLKRVLAKIDYISLTTDLWKNKCLKYFLILTAHFFDKHLNYKSIIIGFKKFQKTHDAVHIKRFILNELNILEITNKVVSITTDNESTVKQATTNLTSSCERISCMCHNLNLAAKKLKLWDKPEKLIIFY